MALALSAEHSVSDVRSVARACDLLRAIAEHPDAGITELARVCGLHKSTASRIVTTMETAGLVERDDTYARFALVPLISRRAPAELVRTVVVGADAREARVERARRLRVVYWRPADPEWEPACMDADELAAWSEKNDRLRSFAGDMAPTPCADCPLGYAAEMRAQGCCNGTPGAVEEDEEPDEPARKETRHMSTQATVNVTAPCESCFHAVVCARRASIADLDTATVEIESPPAGVSVVLTASVTCDAYVKAKSAPHAVKPLAPTVVSQLDGAMHGVVRPVNGHAVNLKRLAGLRRYHPEWFDADGTILPEHAAKALD